MSGVCPECGTAVAETAKFCSECGTRLIAEQGDRPSPRRLDDRTRADATQMAGERKLVTVLFADIVGSMDLAEQVDPERWREIMAGLSRRLAEAVRAYEGTIDKFTGDGIMALFGAPIAHEDHAHRACLAALAMGESMGPYADEIRRTDGIGLALRVGINSGEVVVGGIGEDLGLDYTAVGHTVGLAQRMEGLAEPGTAYATQATARLCEGLVEFDDLGEFNVKGASELLRVHRVAREGLGGGRFEAARGRGFSKFVGREQEMDALSGLLEAAIEGEGSVVGIVAPAGTGKSRLCHEVERLARERQINVYRSACQPHGRRIPYLPVLQMLRSYFGIEPGDSPRVAREKAAGRLLLLDSSFEEDLGLVFDFIGIPDPDRPAPDLGPEARRDRLLALVANVMARRGEIEASVNVIEDLHWVDPASEEFLRGLIAATPSSRTLTLANYRPEYPAGWLGPGHTRELRLEPLGPTDVKTLLADLLGADASLDGLTELIAEQARGNPFFVEEIVRTLIEVGALAGGRGAYRLVAEVEEIQVPESVQVILAARIDRLSPEAKQALHCAAVVGGAFTPELLGLALGTGPGGARESIAELVAGEFVEEDSPNPPSYDFVHPLTREVAFAEQLGTDRRRNHASIAGAIEVLYPDRLGERASEIAQHYESADDAGRAASWHSRSFEWLRDRDLRAGVDQLRRIKALAPELPAGEESQRVLVFADAGLLQSCWRAGDPDLDELGDAHQHAIGILGDLRDPFLAAYVHTGYGLTVGTCSGLVGEYYRHAMLGAEALSSAGMADPALQVVAAMATPYAAFLTARYDESLAGADEILRLTESDPLLGQGFILRSPRAFAFAFRALPLMGLGRFPEAIRGPDEGIAIAAIHDRESLAWGHTFAASVHAWQGSTDYQAGVAHARSAIEIGREMGHIQSQLTGRVFLGVLTGMTEGPDVAISRLREAHDAMLSRRICIEFEPFLLAALSRELVRVGAAADAVEMAETAARYSAERCGASYEGLVAARLATALAARGESEDLAHANAVLDRAEDQLAGRYGGFDGPWLWQARAAVLRARAELTGAADALGKARGLATEMGMDGLVAEIEAERSAGPA